MSNIWSKREDDLLLTLKGKNVSIKKCVDFFENRTEDALRYRIYHLKNQDKLSNLSDHVHACLDIETSNFKADIGYMLSWAIYWDDGTVEHDIITRRDVSKDDPDKRIMKSLLKALKKSDVWITYNGTNFDIKFMRTRALMMGIDFPQYGEYRHQDVYYYAKRLLATHRKSLRAVSQALGLAGKTDVNIAVWAKAMRGNKEALALVLEHNIADVEVTYNVWKELIKYTKYGVKSI